MNDKILIELNIDANNKIVIIKKHNFSEIHNNSYRRTSITHSLIPIKIERSTPIVWLKVSNFLISLIIPWKVKF